MNRHPLLRGPCLQPTRTVAALCYRLVNGRILASVKEKVAHVVRVECTACRHEELIPAVGLLPGMRLPPDTLVLDLKRRMRCRQCDAKRKAVVSVRWAAA